MYSLKTDECLAYIVLCENGKYICGHCYSELDRGETPEVCPMCRFRFMKEIKKRKGV